MKTYYSEYVQHCMRFYARHPHPIFRSNADKENWNACNVVMRNYNPTEHEIIMYIYREGDTIPDNIYKISKEKNIKQDTIWKLVNELEHKIAKRRHLI